MKSVLCPTCGCSLVRLQISREQAVHLTYDGADYYCDGCARVFRSDSERYLAQIRDVVVCPACLGEKLSAVTTTLQHSGMTVNFCGCPSLHGRVRAGSRSPHRTFSGVVTRLVGQAYGHVCRSESWRPRRRRCVLG
jgi:uncharacterized protein YbaR (Trm112 family)